MKNRKHDVVSLAAIVAAICLLWVDVLGIPKSAWWGTAFSIMCGEAVEETAEATNTEEPAVTYRWWISDWWNGKTK